MPYIIDGHNLIPKVPGLSLAAIDDEHQLIQKLQDFCRRRRKKVEVYFDNAAPGQAGVRTYGNVAVRFVRAKQTADQAIENRLKRMGRAARNWTIVSSDHRVQAAARAAHAKIMRSEDFAALLTSHQPQTKESAEKDPNLALDQQQINEWAELFNTEQGDQED